MKEAKIMTQKILDHIKERYGVQPEYLWLSSPCNAALRCNETVKWFGVLLGELPLKKLGVNSEENCDVLNLKCDPMLSFTLIDNERIFQGFHMNKEHWISVLLNSKTDIEQLKMLVDMSYNLVKNPPSKSRIKDAPKKQ